MESRSLSIEYRSLSIEFRSLNTKLLSLNMKSCYLKRKRRRLGESTSFYLFGFSCDYLQESADSAIEYILVLVLSPLEDSTHGTFAPTTIAANSAPANFVAVL